MQLRIALHSVSYVTLLCGSMIIIKLFNHFYDYDNFLLTMLLYSVFAPINVLPFLYISKGVTLEFAVYSRFFIPALLYTAETVLLSFTLNHMDLGLYVIARTSYSIFNYFSYKYLLHRTLNRFYYMGIAVLILSYLFIFLDYSSKESVFGLILFGVCLATGMSTSLYNTLAEVQLSCIKEHKLQYTLLNNVIFQCTSFVVYIPIVFSSMKRDAVFYQWDFLLLCGIAALGLQVYSINKFFLLNDAEVNGSMIVSSLDLLRRIVLNTVSYTVLAESLTTYSIVANGLLLLASGLLFYSSNSTPHHLETPHNAVVVQSLPTDDTIRRSFSSSSTTSTFDAAVAAMDEDNPQPALSSATSTTATALESALCLEMIPVEDSRC